MAAATGAASVSVAAAVAVTPAVVVVAAAAVIPVAMAAVTTVAAATKGTKKPLPATGGAFPLYKFLYTADTLCRENVREECYE